MKIASFFSGIGGLELGLHKNGHQTVLFCEIDPGAQAVLKNHFPGIPLSHDVREISDIAEDVDLLTAGFPCQDLSQAGKTVGINGKNSGLVDFLFKILKKKSIPSLLIENVPFMLQLDRGHAIRHLVTQLEHLGYEWAYRTIDANCFGIPQRRERVFLVASKVFSPSNFLFFGNCQKPKLEYRRSLACGFYWTEGVRGLGWAVNGVPTIKGGSTIGIPSPPAIWMPDGSIIKPDIRDAERLQGFDPDWTLPSEMTSKKGHRWKLVGNAVCVAASEWIGKLLSTPSSYFNDDFIERPLSEEKSWPIAAYGTPAGDRWAVDVSTWPESRDCVALTDFLKFEPTRLSLKATVGFYNRLTSSTLKYPKEFQYALKNYIETFNNLRN